MDNTPITCHQLPTLDDNYTYIVTIGDNAIIIDPAIADDVLEYCAQHHYTITHILNTHHHYDHVGGNIAIKQATNCTIIASQYDEALGRIPAIDISVQDNDLLSLHGVKCIVLYVPGHTLGHVAYYIPSEEWLFCGDTIFALGCGRLFEGTPAHMLESLNKIRQLPDDTLLYCAHEYTQTNAEFTASLGFNNPDFQEYYNEIITKRQHNIPTIPTTLKQQKKCNIFLQTSDSSYQQQYNCHSSIELFTHIRHLKDIY